MPPLWRRTSPWPLRVVLSAALAILVVLLSRYPFDDAFIHLRVARNLAFAGQPFFNTGEPVMGSSSPLWLAVAAIGFKLTGMASREVAVVLAATSLVLLQVVTDLYLSVVTRRSGWLTAPVSFLLVTGLALPAAGFLMEPPLALALAVGGLLLLRRGRPVLAGVAVGLAVATRYELVVFSAALLLVSPQRRRLLAGLVPVAVVECVLLLLAYHSVVPNTMGAKDVVYQLAWADFLKVFPSGRLDDHRAALAAWLVGTAAIAALAAAATETRDLAALALLPLVLVGSYAARKTFVFDWYWPLSTFPAALAAVALASATRGIATVLSLGAAAIVAVAVEPHGEIGLASISPAIDGRPDGAAVANLRAHSYARIGGALDRVCPGSVVLAPEIGALGWAYPGPILDAVGLVSPQVLRYHPLAVPSQRPNGFVGAVPARAIEDFRPDAIVGMEVFLGEALRKLGSGQELREYRVLTRVPIFDPSLGPGLPKTLWGSRWTLVLVRQGGPCDQPARLESALAATSPGALVSGRR